MLKQAMDGAHPTSTISATTEHNPSCNDSCSHSNSSSKLSKLHKGVRKRKWGKWVSEIRLPNSRERIWLGSYDTQDKAARAFDAALYCLRGRQASFNFPDTPLNLEINVAVPGGVQSLSPQEIQEVAAKYANDPPLESTPEEEPSESHQGANSFGLFESISKSATTSTTSSSPLYDYDGPVHVDHGAMMDWTFLNMLDDSFNWVAGSDFGLYPGPDNMHSGELLHSTPPPPLFEDKGDEIEGDDAFSKHSVLWSWNF